MVAAGPAATDNLVDLRAATAADAPDIRALLSDCALVIEDLTDFSAGFFVARRAERLVGVAAVERYGEHGLLRSVAVREDERGRGLAARLCETAEEDARQRGIERLFLLTETAERYFARRGYRRLDRARAPADLAASAEFAALCPQSAVLMTRYLAPTLPTERLMLRPWRTEDREPFAAMNADPRVMEHFPRTLSRAESDASVDRIRAHFDERGFGLWAVEAPGVCPFAGFVGLAVPRFEAAFTPCVEVGWRLAADWWGRGWATEGARAALAYGFERCGLDEILSFTAPQNLRSRRVMERLGMHRDPADDFDHPNLPEGHVLRRHVLYRLRRAEFSR